MLCPKILNEPVEVQYRHDVYSNLPREGEKAYQCGIAYTGASEGPLRLKLWMFQQEFYLARARNTDELRYTIFASKRINEENVETYLDPVGWAVVSAYDKEFLELRFKFPRQCLYMSLHPKESY